MSIWSLHMFLFVECRLLCFMLDTHGHRDQETAATCQFVVRSLFGLWIFVSPFPLRTSSRLLMQTKADQWNSKNFRPCPLASTSDLCRATMACPWSFSILFPPKAWQSPWPRGSWQLRNYRAVLFVKGHTCRCPVALSMKGNPGILVVRCCKKGDTFMQDAAICFFWDQSVCYSAC